MELNKTYEPKEVEEKWSFLWEKEGFFHADESSSKKPFTIILPPPNVTGVLHMGHALVNTLQDIIIRKKRMEGLNALWLPGTDHAGIATQSVLEKELLRNEGKRRWDYSREEFLKLAWKFKEDKAGTIISQLKKIGSSLDWSRLRFTMDEMSSKAVFTTFKKLFDEGLIYRGNYLVNWDPVLETALADDEVEYEERESSLWYIRYPIENSDDHLVIATTRPETMLGDTAVAVNPEDARFQSLLGKKILLPFTNRKIPIIADDYVDPDFGSGCVKITPAHDPNDYEMGKRHQLEMINIMTPDGKINEIVKEFSGLSMEEARYAIIHKLKKMNLLEKTEAHPQRVGVSYRSKAVIEPYLSKQWFIKMEPFKEKLLSAVREKRVRIVPDHFEKTYFHWIENLRDWCISRQLWWGHRIPVFYHKDDPEKMICEVDPSKVSDEWIQDEDVLDTWFSSALWPFSTLGWPEKTKDLETFYPTNVLVTGHDILFFWVARMIMMGEYVMEKPPFHETFIHGLIYGKSYWREQEGHHIYVPYEEKKRYDLGEALPKGVFSKWEKMSKSKGNVIDPIEVIEEYGTDAMRMALTSSVTHARQIDLDQRRFEEYRNFANKVWNGARFILMNLEDLTSDDLTSGVDSKLFTLEDRWILSLYNRTIENVTKKIDEYAFDEAAHIPYEFYWNSFCSYYLELTKPYLFGKKGDEATKKNKQKILLTILFGWLRLMHPIAPFITEELFSLIKTHFKDSKASNEPYMKELLEALAKPACAVSSYPTVVDKSAMNEEIEKTFSFMEQLIYEIRKIRGHMQITPGEKSSLYISSDNAQELSICKDNEFIIRSLVRIEEIFYEEPKDLFGSSHIASNLKLFIPLPEKLMEKEKSRLEKEEEKLLKSIESMSQRLSNQEFIQRAPKEVVEKLQLQMDEAKRQLEEAKARLSLFRK